MRCYFLDDHSTSSSEGSEFFSALSSFSPSFYSSHSSFSTLGSLDLSNVEDDSIVIGDIFILEDYWSSNDEESVGKKTKTGKIRYDLNCESYSPLSFALPSSPSSPSIGDWASPPAPPVPLRRSS